MMQTLIGADGVLATLQGRVFIEAQLLDGNRTTVIRSEGAEIELDGWRVLDAETRHVEYIGFQPQSVVTVERAEFFPFDEEPF